METQYAPEELSVMTTEYINLAVTYGYQCC